MDAKQTDRRIAKVQLVMEALLLGLVVELPFPCNGKRLERWDGHPTEWTIGDLVVMTHFMSDDEVSRLSERVREHRRSRILAPSEG